MFIALILTDGRFFIGAIDMSILLAMLARATDTKGYPDDKNPDNWKTINHAHVHLDNNGNIDGGAGEKFKGNAWTSENHPFKGAPKPKPTTKEDLDAAWKKVVKYKVAMNQSKSQATYEKHAQNLQNAIEEYKKLEGLVPDGTPKPKHNVENMEQHAAKPYAPKEPLAGLAEATAPQIGFAEYYDLTEKADGLMTSVKYSLGDGLSLKKATEIAKQLVSKGFTQENYDNLTLSEKKAVWGVFGNKASYMDAVKQVQALASGNSGLLETVGAQSASPLQGLANATSGVTPADAKTAIANKINEAYELWAHWDGDIYNKKYGKKIKPLIDAGFSVENLSQLDSDDIAELESDYNLNNGELEKMVKGLGAINSLQSSPTSANMEGNGLANLAAATTVYKAKSFKSKAISTLKKIKMLDAQAADDVLHDVIGKVWKKAPKAEKEAAFEYTHTYSKYNEPLRGIVYGTSQYVGPGNIDMDQIGVDYKGFKPGEVKEKINNLTNIIDKCALPQDMQLMRGCNMSGMDKFFGKSLSWLEYASDEDLQTLVDQEFTDHGFMSTGCAEGKGFDYKDVIMTIYAPKGTKGMYVEPFSKYGMGAESTYWDGEEKFKYFGGEQEVVLQRSTSLKVKSVKRAGGKLYFEMQVVSQDPQYLA